MGERKKFNDLADAIEYAKEMGFTDINQKKSDHEILDITKSCDIIDVYNFEQGTNPGDEATLYLIRCEDGNPYFIALSFGMYQDPDKADWVDILERKRS
ncbi:MAG: hypothetical protein WD115_06415 [Balneolaceae bacterium]